jgi:hypothetical protein
MIRWQEIRSEVQQIFLAYSVDIDDCQLLYRCDPEDPEDESSLTLFVESLKNNDDDRWVIVADDIRTTLITMGLGNITLEIIDSDIPEPERYPIKENDPIVAAWGKIKPVILNSIEGLDWCSVGVVNIGRELAFKL